MLEYYGKVTNGILKIRNRKSFDDELKEFEGKEVSITVKKYQNKRTDQQNKYYFVCVGLLAEYTGFSKNEMHEIIKCKLLKRERIIEKTGEVVEYLASTSTLKKGEFIEFMDRFVAWSGELGCTLPPPNTQFELLK